MTTRFSFFAAFVFALVALPVPSAAAHDADHFVREARYDLRAPVSDRGTRFGVSVLGPIRRAADGESAQVWQGGAFVGGEGENEGLTFGVAHRWTPSGGRMAGVNLFADWERAEDVGNFVRYSAGMEFRSPRADFFANVYVPGTEKRTRRVGAAGASRVLHARTPSGYDAEAHFRPTSGSAFSFYAGYAHWDGKGDAANANGAKYGVIVSPRGAGGFLDGVELEMGRDDSREQGRKIVLQLSFVHEVGSLATHGALPRRRETGRDHFYQAARRDESQRVMESAR